MRTHCRGQRREETFENVLRNPLAFPAKPAISAEAQDLISKLLVKDPAGRLGTKAGAEEIKAHPWFEGVNWPLLRQQTPPYVPRKAAAQQQAQQQAQQPGGGFAPGAAAAGGSGKGSSVDSAGGAAGATAFDNY
jgi:serine/threonine protein kinase